MKRIVLISCVSKKLVYRSKAKDLYISPLFKKNLQYAHSLNPDLIFILSAEYGLVGLNDEIDPYDKTLNNMPAHEIKRWATQVLLKLERLADQEKDEFVFLAGNRYRKYLIPHVKNYKIPMEGLGIGKQLQWLSKDVIRHEPNDKLINNNYCAAIHELFNAQKRHSFPFDPDKLPVNGIYVLFEKGEHAHTADRIVRIGTHTGEKQLKSRLYQHFLQEKKDRSIFRKNIGRALLCKENDSFAAHWEIDLTTREARNKFAGVIDEEKQKEIERRVTKYIQDNFSFVVIPVDDKTKRLHLESRMISTVSRCDECKPSDSWLGNHSPKDKIRRSGLWQVNELWREPLSRMELNELTLL